MPSEPTTSSPPARNRRRWLLALKIAITVAVFAGLLWGSDLERVGEAVLRVPWANLLAVLGVAYFGTALAALRWRIVLQACGATRVPPLRRLFGLMLIGIFYNSYVPGGVGGELVRGYATADSFAQNGLPRALAVCLLDRICGLAGLLALAALAFAANPLPEVEGVFLWAGAGAAAVALVVVSLAVAPRLHTLLPRPVARLVVQLPELQSPARIVPAFLLSIGTQLCTVVMGYLLLLPLAADAVTFGVALVVLPVATAASYFPLTTAGFGAREAAFVFLLSPVGVPSSEALAASLLLGAGMLVVGGSGGLVNLVMPLRSISPELAPPRTAS